jgi:hypothetical protein
MKLSSKSLFLASKLCLAGGAVLIVAGGYLSYPKVVHPALLDLGLEGFGVLAIVGGVALRKRAYRMRKVFEWTNNYQKITI